ncbi:MAG: type II toxin-antitoxin system VapB family antitoxin [Cyanobacteriota bacterium]
MLLNFLSEEANQLVEEVAILTGESKTHAVIQAQKELCRRNAWSHLSFM